MDKQFILLVDDEEDIRDILSIVLTDMGYGVLTAACGEDALKIFSERIPPIVMTDIKMPGMDGIELLRRIKQISPDTEVIMITGHGDMDLAIKSLKYEAMDFITKPINNDIMEIALKRAEERRGLKQQLRLYTENLERLVAEKTEKLLASERMAAVGQTASGLAHAIKNITGALSGGIFVLDKGFELNNPDYIEKGWKIVKKNVNKINSLSLDLLNFAADRPLDFRHTDPNAPAREVHELIQPQARAYHIDFTLALDDNLPHILMDGEGMHRALLNLVTNAMHACMDLRCAPAEKRILLRSCRSEGGFVEYHIEDNGCGMDTQTREMIFQNFFSTKGFDGTGLGLMITKKIIEDHDGSIQMRSDTGVGTHFTVRLPVRGGLNGTRTLLEKRHA